MEKVAQEVSLALLASLASQVLQGCRVHLGSLARLAARAPRATEVSSVCKVCPVPRARQETKVRPEMTVCPESLESQEREVSLVLMALSVWPVLWVLPAAEVNRERKAREVRLESAVFLGLLDLLVRALAMMRLHWQLCLDKETPRYCQNSRRNRSINHINYKFPRALIRWPTTSRPRT